MHAKDLQNLADRPDLQNKSNRLYRVRVYKPDNFRLPAKGSFDSLRREERLANNRKRYAWVCWHVQGIGGFDEHGISAWDRRWEELCRSTPWTRGSRFVTRQQYKQLLDKQVELKNHQKRYMNQREREKTFTNPNLSNPKNNVKV